MHGHGHHDGESQDDGHGGDVGLKRRIAGFLDNHWVELCVLALVLADVALVSVEAGIDADLLCIGGKQVPFGSPAGEHLIASGHGSGGGHNLFALRRQLRGGGAFLPDLVELWRDPGKRPDVLVCEGFGSHRVQHLLHTCHSFSIAILCIFSVELLMKLWAIPGFADNPWHRLDMVVVFLSLFVDTAVMAYIESHPVSHRQREQIDCLMVLLVFSRIWRIVRIAHGLYEFQEKNTERVEVEIEKRLHESRVHEPSTT